MRRRAAGAAVGAGLSLSLVAAAGMTAGLPERSLDEVVALMAQARTKGLVGTARRTKPIDAREAKQGEVVVTAIKGESTATESRPARRGDWVVRTRCPQTGNEQYLVPGISFVERYRSTSAPISAHGWREYRPISREVRFHILPSDTAPFTFVAPDGAAAAARPGDAILQDPRDEKDVSRLSAASFACAFDVVSPPGARTAPSGS